MFKISGFSGILTVLVDLRRNGILKDIHDDNAARTHESYKFPSLLIMLMSMTIFHANFPGTTHKELWSNALNNF